MNRERSIVTRRAILPAIVLGAASSAAVSCATGAGNSEVPPNAGDPSASSFPAFVVSPRYGGSLGAGNDQACIQNTLRAANSEGGGLVVLPPRNGYVYKYEQLEMPRWVRFSGVAWHTFGANGSVARLQQLFGVNDDSIIFSDNGDSSTARPWVGPFGITDLVLRGAVGATHGHAINFRVKDGRIGLMQDASTIERIVIRGFAGSGVYNRGGSPVYINDLAVSNCGRFGVEVEDTNVDLSAGSVHHLVMRNISGDSNLGGVADGGGATVYLRGLQERKTAVSILGIKSEYRKRLETDGGDGMVMGNFNALVLDDCACPISVTGVEHIANGLQDRKPGSAIQIKGTRRPDLVWHSVTVRDDYPNQTRGEVPYRVYDEASSRGSTAPHGILGPSAEAYGSDQIAAQVDTDRRDELAVGEAVLPRRSVTEGGASLVSGTLFLTYFTARKTEAISGVRTVCSAQGAMDSMVCRIGIYEVDGKGNLSLVAQTANNPALWSLSQTTYSENLEREFHKSRGATYAVGELFVGTAVAPNLVGTTHPFWEETAQPPRLAGSLRSLENLPQYVSVDSIEPSQLQIYAALVP